MEVSSTPFLEQLRQLESAYKEELQRYTQGLRNENVALRTQVQQLRATVYHQHKEPLCLEPAAAVKQPCDIDISGKEPAAQGKEPGSQEPTAAAKEQCEASGKEDSLIQGSVSKSSFNRDARVSGDLQGSISKGSLSQRSRAPSEFKGSLVTESTARSLGKDMTGVRSRVSFRERVSNSSVSSASGASSRTASRHSTPRDLVFQELAEQKFPGSRWSKLDRKQRVSVIRQALEPRNLLISPRSPFMKGWDVVTALALVFVGIVAPYEAVFLAPKAEGWALWSLNRIVDMVFLADFVLQFFLKVEVQRPHNGGLMMLQDARVIRVRYLKSWFIVDFVSTVPYDLISPASGDTMHRAKTLRLIKLLRMVKLLRMARSSRILERWRDDVSLQFATQRLMTFLVVLLLLSHWMACTWGLVGLTVGQEICVEGKAIEDVQLDKVSWVTTLFLGGKTSPDSACQSYDVYAAALHWAVMTITSIGYGDIVPVRFEEYIICVVCMIAGGVLWAYAIGSVCSIISNRCPLDVKFEQNRDILNSVMAQAELPYKEQHIYREFLREAKSYDRRVGFREVAGKLSSGLQKQLLFHVTRDAIKGVYYFKHAPIEFVMGVASAVEPQFFSRGEALDSLAHCLCMLDRGTVVHNGVVLVPPNVFHEDFIITNRKLQRECRSFALTYTQILVLTRDEMERLLVDFPEYERRVRKYAVRIAFCRALYLTARTYYCFLKGHETEDSPVVSLGLAFTQALQVGGYSVPVPSSPHRLASLVPEEAGPLSGGLAAQDEEFSC